MELRRTRGIVILGAFSSLYSPILLKCLELGVPQPVTRPSALGHFLVIDSLIPGGLYPAHQW